MYAREMGGPSAHRYPECVGPAEDLWVHSHSYRMGGAEMRSDREEEDPGLPATTTSERLLPTEPTSFLSNQHQASRHYR